MTQKEFKKTYHKLADKMVKQTSISEIFTLSDAMKNFVTSYVFFQKALRESSDSSQD